MSYSERRQYAEESRGNPPYLPRVQHESRLTFPAPFCVKNGDSAIGCGTLYIQVVGNGSIPILHIGDKAFNLNDNAILAVGDFKEFDFHLVEGEQFYVTPDSCNIRQLFFREV